MRRLMRSVLAVAVVVGAAPAVAPRVTDGVAYAEATLPTEYAMRWLGKGDDAERVTRTLKATSEPDDGYEVEFWQTETDADKNEFFIRLRTTKKKTEITKKVRGANECPYKCKEGEGEEKREFDVTVYRDPQDPSTLTSRRVCSTSCENTYETRPAVVTSAAPCAGGKATVDRRKLKLKSGTARLERWTRGDEVLWELSAKSEKLTEKDFMNAAQALLSGGMSPIETSKRGWMCHEKTK